MSAPRPVVLLLAAGLGSRFNGHGHKLAQMVAGRNLLAHTLERAVQSGLPVLAVTTCSLLPLARQHLNEPDVVVLPEDTPGFGMGLSIATGVRARPLASGWLILPADMPLVRPETLRQVANALQAHTIAYASHRGKRGHPVGFAAAHRAALEALSGDIGARRMLENAASHAVESADPGVLVDVDTAADLAALRTRFDQTPLQATAGSFSSSLSSVIG